MSSFEVFAARRRLRDLSNAVYEAVFYDCMDTILDQKSWQSYVDDVNGKTLTFDSIDEFFVSADGLAICDLGLFQECLKAVAATGVPVARRAKDLLKRLIKDLRMTEISVHATAALSLPGPEGFAKDGDNQHSSGLDNIKATTTSQGDGGNSAAYLAARLKKAGRDDLLEQVKHGEIKSIRAAAIEAGIIKPVPTVRLVDDLNKVAASIAKHLSNDQRIQLAELLLPDA